MKRRVEVWGAAEIAQAFGVNRSTVDRWADAPDFPRPLAELAMGRVWDAADVRRWKRHQERQRRQRRAF